MNQQGTSVDKGVAKHIKVTKKCTIAKHIRGGTMKHKGGGTKRWGQIGPLLQKSEKFFCGALAKGNVEEVVERFRYLNKKLKPKPN